MTTDAKLRTPWMVAVWPGMGHVALSAGYYMLAKLEMYLVAEFSPKELFEAEHVEVSGGLIRMGRLPRSRLFVWKDPGDKRDVILFIGDAQPPVGKHAFCNKLLEYVQTLGVERVFTFAAMATRMQLDHPSRVFGAATDRDALGELKRLELDVLEDGHIGGLNGVLLGVAAEKGLSGTCLLGEIPQLFAQFPFPKAAIEILRAFSTIAGITIDLTELNHQAQVVEAKLGELMSQITAAQLDQGEEGEEAFTAEPVIEPSLSDADRRRVEEMFKLAQKDRSKAYELKRELDRLDVFKEFEDQFLDLFKQE